jgi:lysophospholipase L1-like esterase
VGRFDTSNPNFIYFSFINSKISFRVKNTKKIKVFIEDSADDYFKVYIDDAESNIINTKFSSRATEYTLVEEMDLNEHKITIIKMTESTKPSNGTDGLSAGRTKIYNFILDPGGVFLSPPPALADTVQFIGDSSYVGYGLRINRANCRYSPSNQDGTLSIPARVADKLNSEVVNISNSGVGIYDSQYDKENKVLDIYEQTVPYLKSPAWSKNDNFRAVFLTAGGNDLIGTPGSGRFPNREGFVSSYTDLVRRIRRRNPRALIVCVVPSRAKNTDQTQMREIIGSIVSDFRDKGDNKVLYFDFWENTDYSDYDAAAPSLGLDYACDYHPGLAANEYMATQLVNFIKNRW